MPVAQGGAPPLRQVLLIGSAAIVGLLSILFLVTQADKLFGNSGQLGLDSGDRIYRLGEVESLAEAVAEQGPLILPDVAGGDDDVILQHSGTVTDEGWVALARPLSAARTCNPEWEPESETFVDSCDGTVYPADGDGLPRYPIEIDDEGQLTIDLNVIIPPEES